MILGIYCAGSLGKELCDIAMRVNAIQDRWEKIIFIDDVTEEKTWYGLEVHHLDEFEKRNDEIEFIIANGTPVDRKKIWNILKDAGMRLTNLVDPSSIISITARLGEGVIITPFSTISSDAVLCDNVLVQSYVRVGHDIHVGNNSVLSSNVGIGGKTKIGDETYIGMGAVIRDELVIGDNVIVGMGAVVHTNIENGVTVVGLPARVSRKNETGKVF